LINLKYKKTFVTFPTRTKNYTIGVIHHMVAMGVDELDQDVRMAHRQNYRRLNAKYPNIKIQYIFAVKQERDGKTNVGFENQFGEWIQNIFFIFRRFWVSFLYGIMLLCICPSFPANFRACFG